MYRRLEVLGSGPIAPTISLPRDITIAGQPAPIGARVTAVGLMPRIAWQASEGATTYEIEITDTADIDEGGDLSRSRVVAGASTSSTFFVVPDGLLVEGHDYFVRVTAVNGRGETERTFAQTVSGFFRP